MAYPQEQKEIAQRPKGIKESAYPITASIIAKEAIKTPTLIAREYLFSFSNSLLYALRAIKNEQNPIIISIESGRIINISISIFYYYVAASG